MGLTHVVDKSVLGHLHVDQVRTSFRNLLERGGLALTDITLLEQRVSARSPEDARGFDRMVLAHCSELATQAVDIARAREVRTLLLADGHHRGPSIPDLLVAAVAERHRLPVLHLDRDFEVVADVTQQAVERVADLPRTSRPPRPPRGSGIVQTSVDGCAQVICASCAELIEAVSDLRVVLAVDENRQPLQGRAVHVHVSCAAPSGYDVSIDGQSWLHGLVTALGADGP